MRAFDRSTRPRPSGPARNSFGFRSDDATRGPGSFGAVAGVATVLGVWLAISGFSAFTPAIPQSGLDASWIAALGEAADRGLRWGPDIAFTYGPASPLVTSYFDDAYLAITLPMLLATCLLAGLCIVLLSGPPLVARLFASTAVGLIVAFANTHPDSVFLVLPLLPLFLVLSGDRSDHLRRGVAAVTALAVGMIGLSKMSYPLCALPIFLLGDVVTLLRRRVPVLVLPFILGFLTADLLYGQSLADLPLFLGQQGEVAAGYGGAMALDGSRTELLVFAAASALLCILSAVAEWRSMARGAAPRAAVPLGLAWVLIVLLKAGFIRQDTHVQIAWFGLALLAILVAVARIRLIWLRASTVLVAVAVAGAALLGLSSAGSPDAPLTRRIAAAALDTFVTRPAAQITAAWSFASDPRSFAAAQRAAAAEGWRTIAAEAPLPHLEDGVDIIPSLQSRVIAAGLDYRPRPSFQEYSTYTPRLLAANKAFLTTSRAPRWILFGPETALGQMTIDGRYPNFAEGALWPELVRLYRPDRRIGDLVALERREVPAHVALGPARRSDVRLDESVAVDPGQDASVFATVDLRPTLFGRLLSLLFRMPVVSMSVDTAGGQTRSYRFIPGIAAAGFVLSPTVNNAAEFVALAGGVRPPPDRTVRTFSLHAATRFASLLWQPASVAILPLSIGAAPSETIRTAWDALAAGEGLAPDALDLPTTPPSLLSVPVSGLEKLELDYGLARAEDETGGSEVLCFAVHPADGTGRILWRTCLDRRSEADRRPHALSLALPADVSEVALETSCQSGCDEGIQGYWGRPSVR